MDFRPTSEQAHLRQTVRAMLSEYASSERVRAAMAADGFDREAWRQLGQFGAMGLAVPEKYGGSGASFVESGIVLEEAGRRLLAAPYLSTVTAAAAIEDPAVAEEYLPGLADGSLIATLATSGAASVQGNTVDGVEEHVLDGHLADLFLVVTGTGLYAVRAEHTRRTALSTLDRTRRQARVEFDGAPALFAGRPDRTRELLWVALAAESVGVARASLELTVSYLKTRHQFGVPIGSFQALRHRCADLAVAVEAATSMAYHAVRVAASGDPELSTVAPMAKAYCADVAYAVAAEGIQLHGGIGFTWEHDAHLYLKRAASTRLLCGDPVVLRRLVGRHAGI
jgi:alkylation response protein AidB-like acyl-CoA dehydrogenase